MLYMSFLISKYYEIQYLSANTQTLQGCNGDERDRRPFFVILWSDLRAICCSREGREGGGSCHTDIINKYHRLSATSLITS